MKKILTVIIALAAAYYGYGYSSSGDQQTLDSEQPDQLLEDAIRGQLNDVQVKGSGTVVRVLPDDTNGSRHQRFVIRLTSGQTLLIAHNIDLAPRIGDLKTGQVVSFFGEYEWNERGGVIHWTHHDPAGRHVAGWLERDGKRYQ